MPIYPAPVAGGSTTTAPWQLEHPNTFPGSHTVALGTHVIVLGPQTIPVGVTITVNGRMRIDPS